MFMTTRRAADPFLGIRRLNQMLDDAFTSNWFADANANSSMTASWIPACDVFEDRDGIKIVAELPGVRAEDVKLSVENNVLTIRGEKKQVAEEKTERVHRYERTYGTFERTFALPSTVDVDQIDAAYDAGLLTVTLPKAERARPREIQVKSLSGNGTAQQVQLSEGRSEARSEA
jgi:HSP20 family protein